MSTIHIKQIERKIRETYSNIIDTTDLSESDRFKDEKLISRCLAAYTVQVHSSCSTIEAAASVTDGGDDNGLDAIFYSKEQSTLFLVQSKWIKNGRSEPKSGDISKFCTGVRNLFNFEKERFNQRIQSKWDSITDAITSFGTRYSLIISYTSSPELAKHSIRIIEDLETILNDPEPLVSTLLFNLPNIYRSLAQSTMGSPIDLEIGISNWGTVSSPNRAYYGSISGDEIASWWRKYGDQLFTTNLRKVLGPTDVNQEINQTIQDCPDHFWYFNNGITIVAEKVERSMIGGESRELGSLKASGVSIVNGAQTVSTIGRYNGLGNNLSSVKVPVRIISLENAEDNFGSEITRTNNRQNRIEPRDFIAQDPEQVRIQNELLLEGITYNLSRSESFTSGPKAFDLLEATLALACANPNPNFAVMAKTSIGRFWLDPQNSNYKTLFNKSTNGIYLYRCVIVHRLIESAISRLTDNLEKNSGRQYGLLIHGNRLLESLVFEKSTSEFTKKVDLNFDTTELSTKITSDTQSIYLKLNDAISEFYSDNILATLFKNPAKSDHIYRACLNRQPPNQDTSPSQTSFMDQLQ